MRRLLLVCLFALAVSPLSAAPETVSALSEAYENPTLGPAAPVDHLKFSIGSIVFELSSGSAATVSAGGKAVGIFFTGSGQYTYTSSDAIEAPLVNYASGAFLHKAQKTGVKSTIQGAFGELYLLAGGIELPAISPSGGAPPTEAFKKHQQKFSLVRWAQPTFLLIRQRIDFPETPVVFAELDDPQMTAYAYDSIEARSESLIGFERHRDAGIKALESAMFPAVVSEQPIGRDRKAFVDPPYLLTDLDYSLVDDGKENVKLSVVETIQPRNTGQSTFAFNLASNVWDTDGDSRVFHLDSVKDDAGHDLPFRFVKNGLLIGTPQKTTAAFKVHFEISGRVLFRPSGDSFWELGTFPWFPQPDLNGQYYTVHSVLRVKKPFTPFAPGDTVGRREEGDYNVVETRITKPVQFAVAHAGKYGQSEEMCDDLTIRVASYAGQNDRAMKQLSNLACKMIKFYEPWLGPFPFKEFNIIEIHRLGYGQAPPATMFITKEAFNPMVGEDNQFFSKGLNERFAHEIAHQYWGHVVKMGSEQEQWVTESFAEICASLVIRKLKGDGGYDSLVSTWKANAREAATVAPIPLANRITIKDDYRMTFINRTYLLYDKGPFLLAVLRKQLGDTKFLSFLRTVQGVFAWRFLTTNDLAGVLQRIDDGKDYKPFFDQYFWGTEMPKMP